MNERMVKFRLVTYWDEVESNVAPNGDPVLVERTAVHGQVIELRPTDEKRLDDLGALYTDDEAKEIEAGTYKGEDADVLYASRTGLLGIPLIQPVEGETGGLDQMDAAALAEYINENKLNVSETVALADDTDAESIQKVLDAENIATDNSPRQGVTDALEKKLAALPDE